MTLRRTRWTLMALLGVASVGCNMLTGAGDLRIGDGNAGGADASSASSSSGNDVASSSSGSSTGPVGSGGNGPIDAPLDYADGANITDLDLYQAIRRPIVENGQPAQSDIPIVAGKDAMLRVFYATDASYDGQTVIARLTVGDAEPVEVEQVLGGVSTHLDLNSTINIDVPGEILTAGSAFKVELLQPAETVSGGNGAAAYPSDGSTAPMEIEQGAVKLKIVLVPVQNNGSLPDTSDAQVARYHRYFSEQYPVPSVEVTVRSNSVSFNGSLGSYNGWSALLDQITDLRTTDNAPDDVYYYGVHAANGNGLLGLGWVAGANDVWGRTAIGVGGTGDTAPETAVHELGHNHGRPHSPCGVSGDGSYPHSGARIGVWGYRPSDGQLLDPNEHVDFMSYCDPPWMSDHSFKKLFDRAKIVSTQPYVVVPPELQNRVYDRIKILDGVAYVQDTVTLPRPPAGEQLTLTALVNGTEETLTGSYYAYDHVDGGVILVMRPIAGHASLFSQVTFTRHGHLLTATR